TSTLNITTSGTINDVNVIDLIGTHSWIEDLIVTIESPQGTVVTLWEEICNSENDFDVNFDDAATPGALPCPPVGGGTYQPQDPLAAFNGENPQGTWTLTVEEVYFWDGGSLNSWGLEICMKSTVIDIEDKNSFNNIIVYPNPFTNQLFINTNKATGNIEIINLLGEVVVFEKVNSTTTSINVEKLSKGTYIYKFTDEHANVKIGKLIKQ